MVGRVYHGEATTWNASWATGNCLFQEWPSPIARSSNLWNSAAVCGAVFLLQDLSELTKELPALASCGNGDCACNFSTPIKFINKDGVSKDWNSVKSPVPRSQSVFGIMPITNPGSEDIESKSWIRLTKQSNSNNFQPESERA
ncbi:hypothetical protein H4Q26_004143 [Puccinia striiformis f. sp. tritici PST-130]|nr:hypothetical protein H4Q26_004143 [Puccinia striiformis f. sp. tritici PST-130]